MPIRINFLAEEQAAEDLRRRDPVKRNMVFAIGVVGLLVLGAVYLIIMGIKDKGVLGARTSEWEGMKASVEAVEKDEKRIKEIERNLTDLTRLATNRFLWAPVLDALQQTLPEHVAVTRFEGQQAYIVFTPPPLTRDQIKEGAKPKPPSATQKITLRIKGIDTGERSDRAYSLFLKNVSTHPYFTSNLVPNGVVFSVPPSAVIDLDGKQATGFELECRYPEVVR